MKKNSSRGLKIECTHMQIGLPGLFYQIKIEQDLKPLKVKKPLKYKPSTSKSKQEMLYIKLEIEILDTYEICHIGRFLKKEKFHSRCKKRIESLDIKFKTRNALHQT